MARAHRGLAAAAALACAALLTAGAAAATLPTLHVDALSMRADRTHVAIGEVFHLAVHVHVRERVDSLDDVVMPDVGTLQLLGDERTATHGSGGTDVTETLTLQSAARGTYTLAPAYLDAIDARDRRPKRFSAQRPVVITVAAPSLVPTTRVTSSRIDKLGAALWGVVWRTVLALALIGIGITAAVRVLGRRGAVIPNDVERQPTMVAARVDPPRPRPSRIRPRARS